ncbi:hypothetical protein CEXT_263451 [Caerostris extrusa]|uniref:Uncharacterized protein n=1 Tax=Caerostris extrusa TaxID=172846 RepID=A0AAV4SEP8_CAEEX|nr:hypothetical protein CEXT_263451 [Caerostris extrusa]
MKRKRDDFAHSQNQLNDESHPMTCHEKVACRYSSLKNYLLPTHQKERRGREKEKAESEFLDTRWTTKSG